MLKAVGEKIERLGAEPSVVYRLAEMGWSPDWIEAAVYRAMGTSKSITGAMSVGYLRAILKGFGDAGPDDSDRAKVAEQKRPAPALPPTPAEAPQYQEHTPESRAQAVAFLRAIQRGAAHAG